LNNPLTIWPSRGKEVSCPHCNKSQFLLLHDLCAYYTCTSCDKYIDNKQHNVQGFKPKSDFKPIWPIGKSGIIKGNIYQLVGVVHRKEKGASYHWQEYCFYNPLEGLLYLSEYEGNWIILKETSIFPQVTVDETTIKDVSGEEYDLFLRYKTECLYIIGEFPFDVRDDGLKLIKEFIAPPLMYLKKEYNSEIIWLKGEHVSWKALKIALSEPAYEISKVGKGSIEPQKFGMNYVSFIIFSCICLALMAMFSWYLESNHESKLVYENHVTWGADDSTSKVKISEPFLLEGSINNVEFNYANNDIMQTWLEVEASLINEETDEEFTLTKELYFYQGSDSEGPWTENQRSGKEIISGVPAGRYHLQLTPYFGNPNQTNLLHIQIVRGVIVSSNLYWMIGLLALLCFIQYQRYLYFERNRWSNSNYSTYDHRSWMERNY
jgi:hypothetical protein